MKVTRKGFISSVATAVAATMASSASPAFAGFLSPTPSAKSDSFSAQIGSTFELAGPDGARARVVLNDLVKVRSDVRTEQFSLLFTDANGASLPEGLYRVRHSTLGAFDLFLMPGGKNATLRADFSLLKA